MTSSTDERDRLIMEQILEATARHEIGIKDLWKREPQLVWRWKNAAELARFLSRTTLRQIVDVRGLDLGPLPDDLLDEVIDRVAPPQRVRVLIVATEGRPPDAAAVVRTLYPKRPLARGKN
jgi:hypothetical protein